MCRQAAGEILVISAKALALPLASHFVSSSHFKPDLTQRPALTKIGQPICLATNYFGLFSILFKIMLVNSTLWC